MSTPLSQFTGVTVMTKANIYFNGDVVSHTIRFPNDEKKTLGLIRPGAFHFNTDAPERMEIVAGTCRVMLDGQTSAAEYTAGGAFDVPGKSGFGIEVRSGLCEYVCSFLAP